MQMMQQSEAVNLHDEIAIGRLGWKYYLVLSNLHTLYPKLACKRTFNCCVNYAGVITRKIYCVQF